MKVSRRKSRGLTLIELLIAIAILAVLAVLASTLLGSSLENQKHLRSSSANLEELGLSLTLVRRDLEQTLNRKGRDLYGERQTVAIQSFAEGEQFLLEFTRDGRRQLPGETLVSSLERVRYALEDGELIRYSAAVPDPVDTTRWRKQRLASDVVDASFGFFSGEKWERQWPPEQSVGLGDVASLPQAVSLRLETKRWGVVELIILLTGGVDEAG
ncbi:general secretion pathway protein J [Litorivivens lipolytica]|uniref:Type II secretion system protein J n=1 Tax=Litorivivens lipolytica TaxID=1524264 RepID=A0A7W4W736_9GAMM|nr:type II secretion system minor pseudopilin GspJ [Litorivivens lipolytica]MBB3048072.1 general secretion pathway protein J [Litorivivens lipolytica]